MAKGSPSRPRKPAAKTASISAQVFLEPAGADAEDLGAEAARRVREASETAQAGPEAATVQRVHPLARSFSVEAAPAVLEALGKAPGVRAVLPNEQPDLLIRPVRKRREE